MVSRTKCRHHRRPRIRSVKKLDYRDEVTPGIYTQAGRFCEDNGANGSQRDMRPLPISFVKRSSSADILIFQIEDEIVELALIEAPAM